MLKPKGYRRSPIPADAVHLPTEENVYPTVQLKLPRWIEAEVEDHGSTFPTVEDRMAFVIHLAERNIQEGGGPFGAGVFEIETGHLVAPGVNRVVPLHASTAHAETLAIMVAQSACKNYDLGAPGLPAMELVTSAQPCIQCYGVLWWSGLQRLVVGATTDDVEQLTGFVEGPIPPDWAERLENRPPLKPIEVITDVLGDEAREVLAKYKRLGGKVYNPTSG